MLDPPRRPIYHRNSPSSLAFPVGQTPAAAVDQAVCSPLPDNLRASRALIIWIVILLLFIGSIAAAYFGARYWHWAHVTLVVFVFLAAVGFFVLTSEVLRINAVLRKQANQLEVDLAQVKSNIDGLERGTKNSQIINQLAANEVAIPEEADSIPSLSDLEHRLHLETRLRGRVWRKIAPAGFDPQTGTLNLTIESPQPSGIAADTIVFLFEQGQASTPDPTQGAQYLGEFRVKEAVGQQATLVAVNQLDEVELQRLANSPGPWSLHETMPIDRNSMFAGLSEKELRKLLPEESVEEYLRQGTPAGPDDDQWHVLGLDEEDNPVGPEDMDKAAKKVYQRRLRDYASEFAELNRRRVALWAGMEAVAKDNERLQLALASAEKLQAFREEEIRKLSIDLAGIKKERSIIEGHLAKVQQQLARVRQQLQQTIAENRRLADELALRQGQPRSSRAPARSPLAVSP